MTWIYVWTSNIKNVYIWNTAAKAVYVWTTKIRPTDWTPWADTIVYYKFNGDIKDYSGNGYHLTGNPTINNGYITLSANQLYNSSSAIAWNSSYNYTVIAWLRNFNTNYSNSLYRCQAWVLSAYAPSVYNYFPLTYLWIANGVWDTPVWTVMGTNALWTTYADGSWNNTWIMVNWSSWTCVLVILDRSTNRTTFYKNWSTTASFTKTSAWTSWDSPTTWIQVWIVWWTQYWWNARYYFWDMWEIILEKKKRTMQERTNYYNSAKSKYGL